MNGTGSRPDRDGHIIGLDLSYNNLEGSIPADLGQLSHLKVLNLSSQRWLWGSIPAELGQLTNLERLDLHNNGLGENGGGRRSIPPELGKLTNLKVLDLSWNELDHFIRPNWVSWPIWKC